MKNHTTKLIAVFLFFAAQGSTQTAGQYQQISDGFFYQNKFDSALHYAWLAEPIVGTAYGKKSKEYAYETGAYLAMNYEGLGNGDSAMYWYQYGISLFEEIADTSSAEYGETLANYGNLLSNSGILIRSLPYLQQGATILKKFPMKLKEYLGSINNLGNYYLYMGEYLRAETLYRQVLDVVDKLPSMNGSQEKAILLQNLATVNSRIGYIAATQNFYKRSYDIFKTLNIPKDLYYTSLNNQAQTLLLENNINQAEIIYNDLCNDTLLQKHNGERPNDNLSAYHALAISGLGTVKQTKGNLKEAEAYYAKAIAISKNLRILPTVHYTNLSYLAHLYASKGIYVRADSIYQFIITDFGKQKNIERFNYFRIYAEYCENLIKMGKVEKAASEVQYFTKSLLQEMYNNLAGMPEQNQVVYMAALEKYTSLMFSAITGSNYRQNSIITFALNNLLQLKGIILNTQIRKTQSLRNSADNALNLLNNQYLSVKQILYRLYSGNSKGNFNIDSLESLSRDYERKMAAITNISVDNINGLPCSEIQARLGIREAAVEYVRYKNVNTGKMHYAAFVITHSKPVPAFIDLCNEEDLRKCFYRKTDTLFNPQNQLDNSSRVYSLILKPLAAELGKNITIYYSPAGLLSYIDFDAIAVAPKTYLLNEKRMILMSGIRNLLMPNATVTKPAAAVLWGKMDYSEVAYTKAVESNLQKSRSIPPSTPLPFATKGRNNYYFPQLNDKEIFIIKNLAHQENIPVKLYDDTLATEDNFKRYATTYTGLLHISSHGFYYDEPVKDQTGKTNDNPFTGLVNPLLRCGITLNGANYIMSGKTPAANKDDGILTGYEVALLDLSKVNLAILSACETGLGDIAAGSEGIMGLQRAFKIAGVKKMMLSLWRVNAATTEKLMQNFYKYLLQKGLPPEKALHLAKKDMAKKNPPFGWAGFVLGE